MLEDYRELGTKKVEKMDWVSIITVSSQIFKVMFRELLFFHFI